VYIVPDELNFQYLEVKENVSCTRQCKPSLLTDFPGTTVRPSARNFYNFLFDSDQHRLLVPCGLFVIPDFL